MCNIARLLILLTVALATMAQENQTEFLKIGNAINIFKFNGILTITMRVLPKNDSNWIFRQPSLEIFNQVDIVLRRPNKANEFDGDFHMEFCDNLDQLFKAYFRNFTIEGTDNPSHFIMGALSKAKIAKYFGIRESLVTNYSYVLIRISRFRKGEKLSGRTTLQLNEEVFKQLNNVTIGDSTSTINFIKNSGSHYIESFITGNSLFQVFVYKPEVYQKIKRYFEFYGISELSNEAVINYFSPDYAEYMGTIKTASGNSTVENWASENLYFPRHISSNKNILSIYGNAVLLEQLNELLLNEALLQLTLKMFASFFEDDELADWFKEYVVNCLKLNDINL
ncbi:torso-like protein [Microplitis mediator]|uniref:torso-like protein n=1 Tax=Microplitis mediator TaxID=375433 RepID=UPI00255266D8|nr:torso-like protein [Microplitis mediator]